MRNGNKKGSRRTRKKKTCQEKGNLQKIKKYDSKRETASIEFQTSYLSISQILVRNPILQESNEIKERYLRYLKSLLRNGDWTGNQFVAAELKAYETMMFSSDRERKIHKIDFYKYFILLDFIHVLGYQLDSSEEGKLEKVRTKYYGLFSEKKTEEKLVDDIFELFGRNKKGALKKLLKSNSLAAEKEYLLSIKDNIDFMKKKPITLMVTANMSAGKSTLINALTGKYVCRSQNLACTSKIHSIINKAFEDGLAYEYDYDLVLTAGKEELMNDNQLNNSDEIMVASRFIGQLKDKRIIIDDSPGVNFSGNEEHQKITKNLIKRKGYNLLLYIMNATQLNTNDESEHLAYVKKEAGKIPVIFIINKVDALDTEEEKVEKVISRQELFLREKGFKNPIICPVSARTGYLAKKKLYTDLSKIEQMEYYILKNKFEEMKLQEYYEKKFKDIRLPDSGCEEELLKLSGIAYVEKMIEIFTEGGKVNGTGLC